MAEQLVVAIVVIPLHRRVFDGSVHSFDLPIGPRMGWICKSMFYVVGLADEIETHLAECHNVAVLWLLCELDTVVCQDLWILQGTACSRRSRTSQAVFRLAFSTNWAKASLLVRSMATKK